MVGKDYSWFVHLQLHILRVRDTIRVKRNRAGVSVKSEGEDEGSMWCVSGVMLCQHIPDVSVRNNSHQFRAI